MGLLTTSSPKKRLFKSLVKLDTSEGGRPKKGRKQKIPGQSREDRKLKANTNKAYVNAKGKSKFHFTGSIMLTLKFYFYRYRSSAKEI